MSGQLLTAKQTNQTSRDEWNAVVRKAEEGSFFHTYDWSMVLTKYGDREKWYHPRHILVRNQDTSGLVGILPLLLTQRRRLVSLPYGDYGGPCIDPNVNREDILKTMFTKVESIARKEAKIAFFKSLPQDYLKWLCVHGYAKTPENYTFILSTSDSTLDSLWGKFHRSPRLGVRKAQKKGVTAEEVCQKDLMKTYYQIYTQNMKLLGASIRPFYFFEILRDVLAEYEMMKLFLAKYQGKYVAGIIAFPWKKTLYLYANSSLEKYQNLGCNYLLCYAALEWAVKHKVDVDFGLSPLDRNSGLYQFKARWGGTPRLLFSASKNYARIADLSAWRLRKTLSERLPERIRKVTRKLRETGLLTISD